MGKRPARKVFTEAMVRRVLKAHYEIEPAGTHDIYANIWCECGYEGRGDDLSDHIVDQLHKLWHEMFGRRKSTDPNTIQPSTVTIPMLEGVAFSPLGQRPTV